MRGLNPRGMSGSQVSDWFGQRPYGAASGIEVPSRISGALGVVQAKSGGSSTPGATYTLTFDNAPTPGNVMVCAVNSATYASAGPSGFTLRASRTGQQGFYIYTRVVQSGDTAAVTWDPNGDYETVMTIVELSGVSDYQGVTAITYVEVGSRTDLTNALLTPTGTVRFVTVVGTGVSSGASCSNFTCTDVGSARIATTSWSKISQAVFVSTRDVGIQPQVLWTTSAVNSYTAVLSIAD